jgi:hypothetical protein
MVKVIKNKRNMICGRCHKTVRGITGKRKGCIGCGGRGTYEDYHYIIINGKYAIDGDTLK